MMGSEKASGSSGFGLLPAVLTHINANTAHNIVMDDTFINPPKYGEDDLPSITVQRIRMTYPHRYGDGMSVEFIRRYPISPTALLSLVFLVGSY